MYKLRQGIEADSLAKPAIYFLLLILIWIGVSLILYNIEAGKTVFEIRPVLQAKILLVALTFLGRHLFFARYRITRWRLLIFLSAIILTGLVNFERFRSTIQYWFISIPLVADTLLWAFFLGVISETIIALFNNWLKIPRANFDEIASLRRGFWNDQMALGFWLTLLEGWLDYYLVSFFIIDPVLYSYLFLIPVLVGACGLFAILQSKIGNWVGAEVAAIDTELASALEWPKFNEPVQFNERLPRYQYLIILKNYLQDFCKPVVPLKALLLLLLFIGFLISLPYIFGIAVPVDSFK